MDEYESLKLEKLSNYIKSKFVKKVTHVVLSVSLFSFFFPHSLPWLSFFHSFSYCFSTFPVQLITHTVDKNCIFFLCNGILVLVVKYSGFISSSKGDEDNNTSQLKPIYLEVKEPLPAREAIVEVMDTATEEESIMEEKTIKVVEETKDEHEENDVLISGIKEEEEKELEDASCDIENIVGDNEEEDDEEVVVIVDEDEEEGEDNEDNDESIGEENTRLSTDELNKKFDEFIRRMKEELRIEARQHMVMV